MKNDISFVILWVRRKQSYPDPWRGSYPVPIRSNQSPKVAFPRQAPFQVKISVCNNLLS
jgi:hypothetical protein